MTAVVYTKDGATDLAETRRRPASSWSARGLPRADNDPLFTYHRWQANLRILDVEAIKSVPYTPTSHPYVERLIGTIRREYLDQVLFWNTTDLERKLDTFKRYYNEPRTHTSLDGNTPHERSGGAVLRPATFDNFTWEPHCGGLFQLPIAA